MRGTLASALLDWPMGTRLFVLAIVASSICAAAIGAQIVVRSLLSKAPALHFITRFALNSLVIGVVYILAAYVAGYFSFFSPANALWFFGIPLIVSLLDRPNLMGALMFFPLVIGGWVAMGLISVTAGIPLD